MRRVTLAWCFGTLLGVLACNDGNTNGQPPICGAGMALNNATGKCEASQIGTGQCGAGQVLCATGCVVGASCPVAGVGGQTVVSTTPAATGGQPATGGVPATGGKPATGGTTSVTTKPSAGGTPATTTTAYVDPNPNACADTASITNTLTKQFQRLNLVTTTPPGKSYVATANWWSIFTAQTVAINGLGFTVGSQTASASNNDPVGYPSIFIGKYQTYTSLSSNLPKLVSTLTTIPTIFDTNYASISPHDNFNAAMDVWFTKSGTPLSDAANAPDAYLMVWLGKPGNRQPRGSQQMTGVTVSGVSGSWNVWSDGTCVSYVSASDISTLTFDLNQFIKHAVSNNKVITNSMYLSVVFGGFEFWSGGTGAKLNNFCCKVN